MDAFRSYAILPAAGRSRRMGTHKLLLPLAGGTLIDRVLRAWTASRVDEVVIVVRDDDQQLIEQCRQHNVHTLTTAVRPAHMRDTIEIGLDDVAERLSPRDRDAWLVAPADMPALTPTLIDRMLDSYQPESQTPVVPQFAGRGGHPVLLPWSQVDAFRQLPPDRGLDAFLRQCTPTIVEFASPQINIDVDTPDDYRRFLQPPEN